MGEVSLSLPEIEGRGAKNNDLYKDTLLDPLPDKASRDKIGTSAG